MAIGQQERKSVSAILVCTKIRSRLVIVPAAYFRKEKRCQVLAGCNNNSAAFLSQTFSRLLREKWTIQRFRVSLELRAVIQSWTGEKLWVYFCDVLEHHTQCEETHPWRPFNAEFPTPFRWSTGSLNKAINSKAPRLTASPLASGEIASGLGLLSLGFLCLIDTSHLRRMACVLCRFSVRVSLAQNGYVILRL